jgi:hypothetical protein
VQPDDLSLRALGKNINERVRSWIVYLVLSGLDRYQMRDSFSRFFAALYGFDPARAAIRQNSKNIQCLLLGAQLTAR